MDLPADPTSAVPPPRSVPVDLPINLGQFLKRADLVGTGGEAKLLVANGCVTVNAEVETRRGRRLEAGDLVQIEGQPPVTVGSSQAGGTIDQPSADDEAPLSRGRR